MVTKREKQEQVRTATVVRIINEAATTGEPIDDVAARYGLSKRIFNQWFAARKDDIVNIMDKLAIVRVQEITMMAAARTSGVQQLLERVESGELGQKELIATLKYINAELKDALTESAGYDDSQDRDAEKYLEGLSGPELIPARSRFYGETASTNVEFVDAVLEDG